MGESDRERAEDVRDLSGRVDRGFDASVRVLEENVRTLQTMRVSLEALTVSINQHRSEFAEHHADLVDEMRAQRAALWRMIDRFDEGGGAAPAA